MRKRNQKPVFESVEDYRQEAEKVLSLDVRNYISGSTGSGATLASNESAFSKFLIRRRVLQGIEKVETSISYFDGKIQSELPFFPSCINLAPMYPKALLDVFRLSKSFKVPICVSDLSIVEPLQMSELPRLVPKTSPLIWQMYFHHDNYDLIMKQTRLASKWGYSAVVVTVDTEQSVKLGYGRQRAIFTHDFRIITDSDIKKIRATTTLPLIAKGIMTSEDAELAVESGADAVVVSNHGGRTMDCGEAAIEALPKIVEHMKSKKATRNAEIFFDSGIRRGTDIIKALALGARGCLIGRPYFWALAVDRRNGIEDVTRILRAELVRTAALCGVRDLSKVDPGTIRTA